MVWPLSNEIHKDRQDEQDKDKDEAAVPLFGLYRFSILYILSILVKTLYPCSINRSIVFFTAIAACGWYMISTSAPA